MDPYLRAATLLVRVIALAFILFSGLYILYTQTEVVAERKRQVALQKQNPREAPRSSPTGIHTVGRYVVGGTFFLVGVILLCTSSKVAGSLVKEVE